MNDMGELFGSDATNSVLETVSSNQGMSFVHFLVVFVIMIVIAALVIWKFYAKPSTLKGGKNRIDNGPLGDAKFADDTELEEEYPAITFEPALWRQGKNRPSHPGLLLGDEHKNKFNRPVKPVNKGLPQYIKKDKDLSKDPSAWAGGSVQTRVCVDDVHAMIVASSGAGKSAFWLYPNMEYALACGQSFVVTDTKGDNARKYAWIAEHYYGYKALSLDLRNPMRSCRFNMLNMVNKYTDLYNKCPDKNSEKALMYAARRETYSKIVAQTIIKSGSSSSDMGANQFFYDAAEGLLQACILLVSEYGKPEERHITSVYKIVQEGTQIAGKQMKFQKIFADLKALNPNDKILMFAGPALNSPPETIGSIASTAMSRILAFLDSEMEQLMCGKSDIDAEDFCANKTVLFITMPEENSSRYFMVSLIVQELYRELLTIADRHAGHIPAPKKFKGDTPRITFFLDEFGTLPKINDFELMMSAARSRGIFFVPILQGTSQLERNYGRESSKIIMDNCKLTYFSGISSSSEDAEFFSKLLGKYTIETTSVNTSGQSSALLGGATGQSKQMTSIDLLSPEEIRHSMKKGDFVILRTSSNPIYSHFDLFLDWGITFGKDSTAKERPMIATTVMTFEALGSVLHDMHRKDLQAKVAQKSQPAIDLDATIEL